MNSSDQSDDVVFLDAQIGCVDAQQDDDDGVKVQRFDEWVVRTKDTGDKVMDLIIGRFQSGKDIRAVPGMELILVPAR